MQGKKRKGEKITIGGLRPLYFLQGLKTKHNHMVCRTLANTLLKKNKEYRCSHPYLACRFESYGCATLMEVLSN